MRDIRVAKPYARALYDAAAEQGNLAAIIADTAQLRELVDASAEFAQFIQSPILAPQFKSETFAELFTGTLQPLTLNFFKLLTSKQRERYLTAILEAFSAIVDEAAGRLVAKVTTATAITPEQEARLVSQLSSYSGKEVRLETHIDATIQGGFIVQLDDTVFDASVASQLNQLKQQLARG